MNTNGNEHASPATSRRVLRCSSLAAPLLLLFTSLMVPPGLARDWIVNAESGADTNDGSAASPLATAQAPWTSRVPETTSSSARNTPSIARASISAGPPPGWFSTANGVTLDGGDEREHGVVARGSNRNVKVFNLSARNFTGEGFLIGGNSRGFQCFGVSASDNGVAGFAVTDNAECWIRGGRFERNPHSFISRNLAESYHVECRFDGPVTLEGGRHSLSQSRFVLAPDRDSILSIEASAGLRAWSSRR